LLILIVDWLPYSMIGRAPGSPGSNCGTGGVKTLYGCMTGMRPCALRHVEKAGVSPRVQEP